MNAHALLTSQGWRGSGHSLHAHNDSIGLARPLLVSQKQNTLGVGKKQHRTSDMWWMNAFDKSLQGLDTSKEGEVVQTVTGGGLDMVKKGGGRYVGTGGLYACFVRGETLVGSVKEKVEVEVEVVDKKAEKKRRREGETKEERRKRKLDKRARRSAKSSANESSNTPSDEDSTSKESDAVETKAQRKERRRLKKASKASKAEAAASQDSSDTPPSSSKDDKKKKKRKN